MKFNYNKPLSEKQLSSISRETEEKARHIEDLLHQVADAVNDAYLVIDDILCHAKEKAGGRVVDIKDKYDFKKACSDNIIITSYLIIVKVYVIFLEQFVNIEKTSAQVKHFYDLATMVQDNLKILEKIKIQLFEDLRD